MLKQISLHVHIFPPERRSPLELVEAAIADVLNETFVCSAPFCPFPLL